MVDSNPEIQASLADCFQDFQYLKEMKAYMIEELQNFQNGVLTDATPYESYDTNVGLVDHFPDGREVRTLFTHGHDWSLKNLLTATKDNHSSHILKFYGFFGRHLPSEDMIGNTSNLVWSMSDFLDKELQDHPSFVSRCFAETKEKMWCDLLLLFHNKSEGSTWRNSRLHSFAVRQLVPSYYSSLRLHSGYLPDGITGDKFHLKQTVFLDYTTRQKDSSAPTKRFVKQWKPADLTETIPYLDIYTNNVSMF